MLSWNASAKTHSATLSTVSFLTEKPRVLMPLVSSLLCGLNTRFSSMLNYDFSVPEAKYAIPAAVSRPTYKLKRVPPDDRSEVSQAFVEGVARMDTASTTVAESTSMQSADSWPGR